MCVMRTPKVPAQRVAGYDNQEALRAADIEARLRRARAGSAANILTGAMGIPAGGGTGTNLKMGGGT